MNRCKDGLFTCDQSTTLKDRLENFGRVEPLLSWWQAEAETILQENGYPTDLQGLSDVLLQGEHSRQIYDILSMLFRLDQTRRAISENRIESAVWNAMLAIQHGMKAKIRPLELDVDRSAKYSKTQSDRRGKRQTWKDLKPEQRQERDEAIWAAYKQTKLTLNSFAIDQGKKHDLSPTSIKNIIKKFLENPLHRVST